MTAWASLSSASHGLGPRLIAHHRPRCLILGFAGSAEGARRLALHWGVRPIAIDPPSSIETLVAAVDRAAIERGILKEGATVVITSKMPFAPEALTNMLKVHTVGST